MMRKWKLDITNLHNEVLGIAHYFFHLRNSKIYEKEPQYNEISLKRTNFASPFGPFFISRFLHCTVIN